MPMFKGFVKVEIWVPTELFYSESKIEAIREAGNYLSSDSIIINSEQLSTAGEVELEEIIEC